MGNCIVVVQFDLPKRTQEQAIKGGTGSYAGFWVTRRDQAAWFTGASRTSMPSLNLTPATIFGK